MIKRYKLLIEYHGAYFSGWQIQPDATTVEGELEKAFSKILQQPIDLIGQGRTDAGVHARGQVAHVDLNDEVDVQKLIFGVNGVSSNHVFIHEIEEVKADFHARFDASSRAYTYTLLKRPSPLHHDIGWVIPKDTDIRLLEECATLLNGEFDFDGFSKFNEENYTTLCTIFNTAIEEKEDRVLFHIQANRFLRNMVRRLIGTMIQVGIGKIKLNDYRELLFNPKADVKSFTAPAHGLVLEKVFYEN